MRSILLFVFAICIHFQMQSQVAYFQTVSFTDSVSTPGIKKYGIKMKFHGTSEQMFYTATDRVTNVSYFGDSIPNLFTNPANAHHMDCSAQLVNNMNSYVGYSVIKPSKESMITLAQLVQSTGPASCDGEINAYVDTAGRNFAGQGSYTQAGFNDASANLFYSAPIGQNNWTGLCNGRYELAVVSSTIGTNLAENEEVVDFYIGANALSMANMHINVNPYAMTSGTLCAGKARVSTNIVPAPNYSFDHGSYTSIDSITGLCAGYHSVNIATATDTIGRFFIITDTSNVVNNPNNYGPVVDTIIYNYQDCNFNYNTVVDSAFLTGYSVIDTNTIFLSWEIWQAGISTHVSDTVSTVFQQGNNMISLVVFCGNARVTLNVGNNAVRVNDYATLVKPLITGIKTITKTYIEVYPNPVSHTLYIKQAGGHKIALTDVLGKVVLETTLKESEQINVSDLKQGIYFLKISGSNEIKKIIKQ